MAHACLREFPRTTRRYNRWLLRHERQPSGRGLSGGHGQQWSEFEVVDAGVAQYRWRSRAESSAHRDHGAAEGGLTLDDARHEPVFESISPRRSSKLASTRGPTPTRTMEKSRIAADVCADIASGDLICSSSR